MNTNSASVLDWQTIGENAYMVKVLGGFIHVLHLGGTVWCVTLNGRNNATAKTADEGKAIAEAFIASNGLAVADGAK